MSLRYSHNSRSIMLYDLATFFTLICTTVLGFIFNLNLNQYLIKGSVGISWSLVRAITGLIFFFVFISVTFLIAKFKARASISMNFFSRNRRWRNQEDALEILKGRYGNGKISRKQYRQMINILIMESE